MAVIGVCAASRKLARELETDGSQPLEHPRPVEVWLVLDGHHWRGHVYARRRDELYGWRGLVAVLREYAPAFWTPHVGWVRADHIRLLDAARPRR